MVIHEQETSKLWSAVAYKIFTLNITVMRSHYGMTVTSSVLRTGVYCDELLAPNPYADVPDGHLYLKYAPVSKL